MAVNLNSFSTGPYHYDGHGINDKGSTRIATLDSTTHIVNEQGNAQRDHKRDNTGLLLASSYLLLKTLDDVFNAYRLYRSEKEEHFGARDNCQALLKAKHLLNRVTDHIQEVPAKDKPAVFIFWCVSELMYFKYEFESVDEKKGFIRGIQLGMSEEGWEYFDTKEEADIEVATRKVKRQRDEETEA